MLKNFQSTQGNIWIINPNCKVLVHPENNQIALLEDGADEKDMQIYDVTEEEHARICNIYGIQTKLDPV